jgi:UrcA family protein
MKTLNLFAALAVTLSGTLAAAPATAQAPASAEQVVVRYADLDLSSQAGVARLNRRILTAVQAACGPESDADPQGKKLIQACRHRSFDQAVAQARHAIALANRDGPTVFAGR